MKEMRIKYHLFPFCPASMNKVELMAMIWKESTPNCFNRRFNSSALITSPTYSIMNCLRTRFSPSNNSNPMSFTDPTFSFGYSRNLKRLFLNLSMAVYRTFDSSFIDQANSNLAAWILVGFYAFAFAILLLRSIRTGQPYTGFDMRILRLPVSGFPWASMASEWCVRRSSYITV